MDRINKIVFLIILTSLWLQGSSQIEVVLPIIKPSGNYGYAFKPTIGLEVRLNDFDFEDKFQYGLTGGVLFLKPRKDIFYGYIVEESIHPSLSSYSHFYSIMFGTFMEYKFSTNDFSPFIGMDVDANGTHYREENPYDKTSYSTDGSLFIGLEPRVGLLYKLSNKIVLTGGLGKYMSIAKDYSTFAYWKTYVCVHYNFE